MIYHNWSELKHLRVYARALCAWLTVAILQSTLLNKKLFDKKVSWRLSVRC